MYDVVHFLTTPMAIGSMQIEVPNLWMKNQDICSVKSIFNTSNCKNISSMRFKQLYANK